MNANIDGEILPGGLYKWDFAFSGYNNLTNTTILDGATEIAYSGFSACPNLSNVTIPSSVITISGYAFQ